MLRSERETAMRQAVAVIGLAGTLAACGPAAPPASVGSRPATALPTAGLERVMGQDAAQLTRLLGPPDADVREGPGRKLQFVGRFCVLDAYLYAKGNGEARVTWVDAREPDGSAIDRASCVAALTRREGGK